MRKTKAFVRGLICLLLAVLLNFTSAYSPIVVETKASGVMKASNDTGEKKYTRFIIKYKNEKHDKEVLSQLKDKVKSSKKIKSKGLDIITSKENLNPKDLISELKLKKIDSLIEYIQPDYKLTLSSNDPYFSSQWGLESTVSGEVYSGSADIENAWEESQGEGVTIGIIDTAIDINHEDLKENIWVNTGEIAGNGIDDDGNGYLDDTAGWNFSEDNNVVNTGDMDHGTHIAGIIAAVKDNGKGIAGVAPKAKVMPLKVFSNGQAYTSDIVEAIEYAEKMGVKVINGSWGSSDDNQALKEAIEGSSMLFVCAAGNGGINIDESPVYPASYASDNVIAVASVSTNGNLSGTSNYGLTSVDVAAPGEHITSTLPGNKYGEKSGTSMSAGFVTGEAVLLYSKSSNFSAYEIKSILITSSDKDSNLTNKIYEGNRVDCYTAVVTMNKSSTTDNTENISNTVSNSVYNSIYGQGYTLFADGPIYSAQQAVTSSVVSVPTGSINGQIKGTLQGKTLINILGEKNYFHNSGYFSSSFENQPLNSLSSTNNIITPIDSEGFLIIPDIYLHKNKKYVLRADVKINSIIGAQTVKVATTPVDILQSAALATDNSKIGTYQTIATLLKPNSDGNRNVILGTCYSNGVFAQIDFDFKNIALYEITDDEYAVANMQQILENYPFVSGSKSTSNLRINSVGKNLIDTQDQKLYVDSTNASTAKLVGYVKVKKNTNYTVHYEYNKISGFTDIGWGGLSIVASNSVPVPLLSEWFISSYDNLYVTEWNSVNENKTINTGNYEYIGLYLGVCGTPRSTVFDLKNVSCVEGNTPLNSYQPFKESTLYTENIQLHSLPNGTRDEISLSSGEYIKKIEKLALDGSLSWSTSNEYDYAGYKRVNASLGTRLVDNSEIVFRNKDTKMFKNVMPTWSTMYQSQVWNSGSNDSAISLTLSDNDTGWGENYIPSQQDIKNYFNANPHTVYFQLAQPEVFKLNISPVVCFEGGTIIVDNAVKSISTYGQSGITIDDMSLPIKAIERIYKLNGSILTSVDYSKLNLASNGLSFTIAGAKSGETYEYEYVYDRSLGTLPSITFSTPINSQAQDNDNTDMINKLIQEIEDLKKELNSIKTDRAVQYEYDANGRLIRRLKN